MPTFEVPDGHKVGIAAVFHGAPGESIVGVGGGRFIAQKPPARFPEHWETWLGSLKADQFRRAGLFVVATERAERRGLDAQLESAARAARETLIGLWLQGTFGSQGGMVLAGERVGDEVEVLQVTDLPVFRHVHGSIGATPEEADPANVLAIAERLRARFNQSTRDHWRVSVGLEILQSTLSERYEEERIHGFVRALDALAKLPPGAGRGLFADRCQTFIGASHEKRLLLDELYSLRGKIEHVTPLDDLLERYPPDDRRGVAALRAFQIEVLAVEVYRRVLAGEELFNNFADNRLDGFWSLSEPDRAAAWGPPMDFEARVGGRFLGRDAVSGARFFYPPLAA